MSFVPTIKTYQFNKKFAALKNIQRRVLNGNKNYRAGLLWLLNKQVDQLEKNLLRIDPKFDLFSNKKAFPLP